MEEIHDNHHSSCEQVNSRMLSTNIIDLNKKRKLQAEQLDFPKSKHLCQDRSCSSGLVTINEISETGILVDQSEHESAKGSNSVAEESYCAMSECDGTKLESDSAISCLDDGPSSSSESADGNGSKAGVIAEHSCYENELQVPEDHSEDHLIALQNHLDYILDQSKGKDLEDIIHPKDGNPSAYVLSSGRWEADQEDQPQTRKPTIDQEFEQYFSTLML